MLSNYHTHTKRCFHATGEDRQYVEKAIESGLKILGFSDHAPYIFDKNYYSDYRMYPSDIDDYCSSVLKLKKEYARDIEIRLGFELEYYENTHQKTMEFLRSYNPEYIILGQHYIIDERDGYYAYRLSREELLIRYVNECIAGLKTGDFIYLAHPELAGFCCTPEVCEREYRRLLQFAKDNNFPIELNGYGFIRNRHYPDKRLFELAKIIGNKVIVGIDAHNPSNISPTVYSGLNNLVKDLNLNMINKLDI